MRRVLGMLMILMSMLLFAGCDTVTGLIEEHGDAKSSNALLKEVTVSEGVWEYDFNKYDTAYSITVSNEVDSIQVKPTTDHVFATVTVEGTEVDSGSNSDPIDLIVGSQDITIIVSAWDGTPNTYTLTVTRNLSTVTSIASFAVLDPIGVTLGDNGSNNYSAVVGTDVQTIRFSIAATDPEADIEMRLSHNGTITVGSDIILNSGLNSFLIKITAEDGSTKEYFTAEVTKLSGDTTDCKVNSLVIERTTLAPEFDADDHNGESSYDFSAEISAGKLSSAELTTNLVLVTNSGIAKTTITDPSGSTAYTEGGQITHKLNASDFTARETPYSITVLVESGDSSNNVTYNIALTVRAGNNDAKLTNGDGVILTWGSNDSQTVVYPGTFASHSPTTYGFLSGYYEYIAVMYATDTVSVTAKANDPNAASITINGEAGTPDSSGEFSKAISLSIGYVTDVTIEVKAEDNTTTASYSIRIRAFNVYEYYWGIYGPLNNKSFARWEYWKDEEHGLTIDDTLDDLTERGTLYWRTTTSIDTYMKWTNYCDGNAGGGTWNVRTDYNYNHPTNPNYDGFVLGEGETYGDLESIGDRDGFVYGGFTLDTPWGDRIAEVMVHYWINDQLKEVCSASWAEILYMGEVHKMMYAETDSAPNPFTDPTFDWESPWIPAGSPLSGFPTAPASDWSWHKQYDNPPSESKPSDCDS